jgi:C-terminal processing protease CtpA/Prc
MQPSDRIISINGRSLENLTIDEARQIIKESGSMLVLEIEFDVAGMRLKCLIFSK